MPVLQSDFNPVGEGTISGAYGLMIFIFGKVRVTTGLFTSTIFVASAFLAGSPQHSTIPIS